MNNDISIMHPYSRFNPGVAKAVLLPSAAPAKTIYDVPVEIVAGMASRLLLLLNLAWDYVETVHEISRTLRVGSTKRTSRRIRELKRIYDQRRSRHIDSDHENKERDLALLFEQLCAPHLTKFHYTLTNEIKRECPDASEDETYLIEAVMTALTMLDAAVLYGADCDAQIRSMGVSGNSIITPEIKELIRLLPEFTAGRFNTENPTRRLTARIILNEIKQIELCEVPNT